MSFLASAVGAIAALLLSDKAEYDKGKERKLMFSKKGRGAVDGGLGIERFWPLAGVSAVFLGETLYSHCASFHPGV